MHDVSGWLPIPLALLLVLGWYLSFSASRLDRLHHRVESSRAALDTQLVRRAAAAIEAAQVLDPSSGLLLADAAAEAMAAGEGDDSRLDDSTMDRPLGREEAENELSRALHAALDDADHVARLRSEALAADALDVLRQACERVQLARRFHNDAVAQAQRVRRKRVVRWAWLAGRARMPEMFEIDDSIPGGLVR
ncbi:MAG TPA: NUDIX hydrolase [Kineosporiaceae bacterium]|nr:NUDIX hydrolase [Kineosporiaceae bacterium]